MKCVGSINISHFLVTIISLGAFLFIGSIIQIEAVKKEGTLLGDYNDLKKLVGDIKNGDFNDDQIPLNDFKNSVAYQDADENMQDCINLAGKIGHNLGDNEIVHCFENANYFKDKYPNVSVPKAKIPPPESKPGPGPEPKAKPSAAQDYNNLKELVRDIKNGDFNDDQISLNDFKNSVAYQDADENIQDCINLAAKIGHNLGDNEIVHCFENTNYFKVKYLNVSVPKAKVPQPESKPERNITQANITQQVPEVKPEQNVPQTNASLNVPQTNASLNVPQTNASLNVPQTNASLNVPQTNASLNVPQTNASLNVPQTNASQNESTRKITLDINVAKDPITRGESQVVAVVASDPTTGKELDHVFIKLAIKDPIGIIVKNYTATEGNLTRSFKIGENAVGKFTILATASQAGVESRKSLTFEVQ